MSRIRPVFIVLAVASLASGCASAPAREVLRVSSSRAASLAIDKNPRSIRDLVAGGKGLFRSPSLPAAGQSLRPMLVDSHWLPGMYRDLPRWLFLNMPQHYTVFTRPVPETGRNPFETLIRQGTPTIFSIPRSPGTPSPTAAGLTDANLGP